MQEKNGGRPGRVAAEIKKVLSEFFLRGSFFGEDLSSVDPKMISITDTVVSPCLQHAKIYVTYLSGDAQNEEYLEFLKKYTPRLRHHIGSKIRLKFVPDLEFIADNSFDYANKIESLLRRCNTEIS
jgi:ribosome-binding factor A